MEGFPQGLSAPVAPRWRRIAGRVLDLLFPCECALCREPLADGAVLCASCEDRLPWLEEPFCKVCGEAYHGRIDSGFSCPNCSGVRFSFEFVRPSLVRDDRVLSMVRRLKYGRELHLAAGLGRLAGGAFRDPRLADALEGRWPLVPVPLHRARFRRRHFNQSEEIARGLSVATGLPMVPAMERVRDTGTQTLLGRRKRMENLRGAFRVRDELRGMAAGAGGVVLVDDVLTTGSTLHECAKELRKAGFRRVVGVTVMRG